MRPLTCPTGIFASSIRGGLTVCASVRRRDLAAISLRLRFQYQARAGAFVNCNCVILDGCEVSIGDKTLIGPAVQILTADHPRDPTVQRQRRATSFPVYPRRCPG